MSILTNYLLKKHDELTEETYIGMGLIGVGFVMLSVSMTSH